MVKSVSQDLILKVDTGLNQAQVQKFFSETPKDKIKSRPAKGGGYWKYVSGSYTTQVLNSLFGFNWSFEIVTSMTEALATANTGTVTVQGRLKVKIGDDWITKEQFGRKDVTYKKDSKVLLDFGNDLKAAATDAKKKCASELGLFADVYSQEDFFEANIVNNDKSPSKWVPSDDKPMSEFQKETLYNLMRQMRIENDDDINSWLWDNYGVGLKDLTEAQAHQVNADISQDIKHEQTVPDQSHHGEKK
jgi:hypothetical protein